MIRARNKRRCPMTPEKESLLFAKGLIGRYAHLRPICLFDRKTGLRLGELTRLEREHFNLGSDVKWIEVDGEHHEVPRDCFIVVSSKNGKSRGDSTQRRSSRSRLASTERCNGRSVCLSE